MVIFCSYRQNQFSVHSTWRLYLSNRDPTKHARKYGLVILFSVMFPNFPIERSSDTGVTENCQGLAQQID
ncbi:hypothetical protein CY34DRAFT_800136 [Suillus luteus UH-Slu-Lm8-n1]|uniref:Unplaced genomic scaffold CY34scaffold_24, whole genome shotgun sequence n=1 Tax=Suillus luteus UH-Slu-Lm8-n1 TaxID=930992 RepID=A0A0D0BUU3_9AGAM|nr:hypothetical protein CY34DRAFT_800136 [Suillus luteus UH-Slu-Lm8-n1]